MKQRWPTVEIHVLANKYNQDVLKNNPDITMTHTYVYSKQCERNLRPGWLTAIVDRLVLIWRLRRLCFDLIIVPNGGMNKNSIQFAKQLNVKDCRWHNAETEFDDRNPEHVASRMLCHEALSGFALMPELGKVDIGDLQLHMYPDPDLHAKWRSVLGERTHMRIGLFISNKSSSRRWSFDKWHKLAVMLGQKVELFIFHEPADKPLPQQIASMNARCLTTPSVNDLVAAMSLLDVVVSADSAPIHISSALNIPVVALFEYRPEKYLRWYPLVHHVMLHGGQQVEGITVEAVAAAVCQLTVAHQQEAHVRQP